jgi:hypothetical protein
MLACSGHFRIHRFAQLDVRGIDTVMTAALAGSSSRRVRNSRGFQWSARDAEGLAELSFLRIPALRDRKTDIGILVANFMECMQRETGMAHTFSDEALDLMIKYDWPGNKRELENAIRRAVALSSGPVLEVADLPPELQSFRACSEDAELTADMSETRRAHDQSAIEVIASVTDVERRAILCAIGQLNGDWPLAAKLLGMGKTTLYSKTQGVPGDRRIDYVDMKSPGTTCPFSSR